MKIRTGHPSDGDLLRYADGEVSSREARQIRTHLAACWECRSALSEFERTIGDCVRYRQSVLRPRLPDPPAPWFDIRRRLAEVDESRERLPWSQRLWEALQATAVRPQRWAVPVALLVIAAIVVDQFRNAPSVQAAELLQKAAAAAESRPAVPRLIQIRTETRSVTRVIDAPAARSVRRRDEAPEDAAMLAALRPRFQAARYDWEDPLSAASFASWRNTLAEKRDEVMTVRDRRAPDRKWYRIRTTTSSSALIEATLSLTASDLRPVEGKFVFGDREWVEIAEVADAPAPLAEPPAEVPAAAPPLSREPVAARPPAEALEAATPADELRVFALLRRLEADLGEPVEVTRDSGQVVVSGVGVSPGIEERIHSALSALPRVTVQFDDPAPGPLPSGRMASTGTRPRPEILRLQAGLEKRLGGRALYEQFADEVLDASDRLMSRVHALRRLAERFPPEAEAQLAPGDRMLLSRLRREHAVAAAGLAAAIEEQTRPALLSLGTATARSSQLEPAGESWQAATAGLLRAARRVESLLAAMLGGAATEIPPDELPAQALSSLAQLRDMAANYLRDTL